MNLVRNLRTAVRIPISYQIKVVTDDEMVAFSSALNISSGGVLLAQIPGLPVGGRCGVVIFLLDGELGRRVVASGMVVRSDDRGTAIQFHKGLNPESADALETLLASLGAEEGDGRAQREPDVNLPGAGA